MPAIKETADLFNYIFCNKRKLEKKLKNLTQYDKVFFEKHQNLNTEELENLYKLYVQRLLITYLEKKKDLFLENIRNINEDNNSKTAAYSNVLEIANDIYTMIGYYDSKFLKTTIEICREELTNLNTQSVIDWLDCSNENFATKELFDQAKIIILNDNKKALELIIDLIATKIQSSNQIRDIAICFIAETKSSNATKCADFLLEHYNHLKAYLSEFPPQEQEIIQLVNIPSTNVEVNDYINLDPEVPTKNNSKLCCNIL
jgi:hypothetical protein